MPKPTHFTDHPVYQFARRHRRWLVVAVVFTALVVFAGCADIPGTEDYNDKHGIGDAPVGDKNDEEKDVIQFPDGFSTTCGAWCGTSHRGGTGPTVGGCGCSGREALRGG